MNARPRHFTPVTATRRRAALPAALLAALFVAALRSPIAATAAEVFVRLRVIEPPGESFRVAAGGHIHVVPWYPPSKSLSVEGGKWSEWIDLRDWPLHGRLDREGGLAEWPTMKLRLSRGDGKPIQGCKLEVQLADQADPQSVVISFTESSASGTIAFLLPHPLREKKAEFETGSQMTARHLAWAREATGGRAPRLEKFELITSIWGHYDPALARQAVAALRQLGFNVTAGVPVDVLRESGMKTYTATWHLVADPRQSAERWKTGDGARIARALETEDGRWCHEHMAHYVICDEIQPLDLRRTDRAALDGYFRQYLRRHGESEASLGRPLDQISYPAEAMYEKTLPRSADLPTRRLMYHAGKFGQWWTVQRLRQTSDLVRQSLAALPNRVKTETLPSDHCFFGAWGAPHLAMGYRGLDLFEIGAAEAVDVISAEDWLGLNHMYGPSSTWTGAAALGYLCAILRSGIGDRPVELRTLITPSDDGYLRLKAYTALAQGAKSFFFWTFGPTYIGTENYWSDLRSEYDGIAKISRALEQAESTLMASRPVRDRVAMLYSVSHDMWHTDEPASFVESRLTWTALRYASIQPDFLREEDVEAGRLDDYQVVYVTGQCLTRRAAARLDQWVRRGGTVCLAPGAATRDEFFTPCVPPFAAAVWPDDAATRLEKQTGHAFNERVDLPTIRPITTARVATEQGESELRVLGNRLRLRDGLPEQCVWATFADGGAAAATVAHGRGKVVGLGFMPGLAYSPFRAGQTTLDERWPDAPREVILRAVADDLLAQRAAAASVPVVETGLLAGGDGAALVLVNHSYQPIERLRVRLRKGIDASRATSTEGVPVSLRRGDDGAVEIELPLEWTDIVLLR